MADYINLISGTLLAAASTAAIGVSYHKALVQDFQYCVQERLSDPLHWEQKQGLETFLLCPEIERTYLRQP